MEKTILNPEKLRAAAFREGVTQKQVANRAGACFATVNGVFNGRRCSDEMAKRIADALNSPLKDLV